MGEGGDSRMLSLMRPPSWLLALLIISLLLHRCSNNSPLLSKIQGSAPMERKQTLHSRQGTWPRHGVGHCIRTFLLWVVPQQLALMHFPLVGAEHLCRLGDDKHQVGNTPGPSHCFLHGLTNKASFDFSTSCPSQTHLQLLFPLVP